LDDVRFYAKKNRDGSKGTLDEMEGGETQKGCIVRMLHQQTPNAAEPLQRRMPVTAGSSASVLLLGPDHGLA